MDELIIEEKKYISSKQAAKITGYAKDYIGQLCREGRVPARLVGRGWYVLESAIQDHRFGDHSPEPIAEAPAAQFSTETWQSPRYEALSVETPHPLLEQENALAENTSNIQDSWKAWFDQVAQPTSPSSSNPEEEVATEEVLTADVVSSTEVPIHLIKEPSVGAALPPLLAQKPENVPVTDISPEKIQRTGLIFQRMIFAIQLLGGIVAVFLAVVACFGTGYFDKYSISYRQASSITGISVYQK